MKHPRAIGTVVVCAAAAAGELALLRGVTPDVDGVGPLLIGFVIGPPLFLALLAWRRRAHEARSRLLFAVAVVVAVAGLGLLGFDYYRYRTDPQFRLTPGRNPIMLPLVQWVAVLATWLALVAAERGEKKPANKS